MDRGVRTKTGKGKSPKAPKPVDDVSSNRSKMAIKEKDRRSAKKSARTENLSIGDITQIPEEYGSTLGTIVVAIEEPIVEAPPPSSPPRRAKGKNKSPPPPKPKERAEDVDIAVADFWESAWNICMERFSVQSAPITVTYELRNTWLRIVEAEWQDMDMRKTPSIRPNLKTDEPPLPLALDTWSRGTLDLLPKHRRESVLDPFLRDLEAITLALEPQQSDSNISPIEITSQGDESMGSTEESATLMYYRMREQSGVSAEEDGEQLQSPTCRHSSKNPSECVSEDLVDFASYTGSSPKVDA